MQEYKMTLKDALESASACLAFSSRDWSENQKDAWMWGILCGWDDAALKELAHKFGWTSAEVSRLKRLRSAVEEA